MDEPYLTSLLTERTGMPSVVVTDALAAHFSFAFQHIREPQELLDKYRRLSKDQQLLARLRADFGTRSLNRSCAAAPPAQLITGRRAQHGRVAGPKGKAPGEASTQVSVGYLGRDAWLRWPTARSAGVTLSTS